MREEPTWMTLRVPEVRAAMTRMDLVNHHPQKQLAIFQIEGCYGITVRSLGNNILIRKPKAPKRLSLVYMY